MSPFSRSEKTLLFINVTAFDLALVTAHNTAYDTVNVLYLLSSPVGQVCLERKKEIFQLEILNNTFVWISTVRYVWTGVDDS